MSDTPDDKKTEAEKAAEAKAAAKAEKAKPAAKATITLKHDGIPGDLLSIGDVHYPVSEGMVDVAPEHLEAALQAGFRPA